LTSDKNGLAEEKKRNGETRPELRKGDTPLTIPRELVITV